MPDNMTDLLRLPGVGRKTANLILGDVYGQAVPFVTENAITGIDEEINIALIATPTITFFALISFTSFDLLYFYLYFIKYFVSSQSVS